MISALYSALLSSSISFFFLKYKQQRSCGSRYNQSALIFSLLLKHCRGADWLNKTIKKERIKQGSVILLCSEFQEDDNDLTPFILKTKYDPRA